jgi:hypothetical protein
MQLCAATGSDHFHYSGVLVRNWVRNLLKLDSAKFHTNYFAKCSRCCKAFTTVVALSK